MSNIRFFQCKECGLMAASLNDKVIPNLNELIPNTVEASGEKHKPVVKVEGDKVIVSVGSVAHPMVEEHWIEWVWLQTSKGGQYKVLQPGQAPEAVFQLERETPVAAYAYCNLHGLWKTELYSKSQ